MMSASSATSGNPSAMYASNMSSNYGTASYGGYSGPKGVKGAMKAPGFGDMWSEMFQDLMDKDSEIWLKLYNDWDGDGVNDDNNEYFNGGTLREYFVPWLESQGYTNLTPQQVEELWQQFLKWMQLGEDRNIHNFRFPIPDGVGVLLVLSLLCVLFTFLRSRDKKILEETENTH
jgi:hypothetical protein